MSRMKLTLSVSLLIVTVFLLSGCSIFDGNKQIKVVNNSTTVTTTDTVEQTTTSTPEIKDYSYILNNLPNKKLAIEWQLIAKRVSDDQTNQLLNKLFPTYQKILNWMLDLKKTCKPDSQNTGVGCSTQEPQIIFYEVGKIKNLNNQPIFYVVVPDLFPDGPWSGYTPSLVFYDQSANLLVKLVTDSDVSNTTGFVTSYGLDNLINNPTSYTTNFTLSDQDKIQYKSFPVFGGFLGVSTTPWEPPLKISLTDNSYGNLYYLNPRLSNSWAIIGNLGDFGITDPIAGLVSTTDFINLSHFDQGPDLKNLKYKNNCFYLLQQNGSVFVYNLQPYFLKYDGNPALSKNMYPETFKVDIKWNKGINIKSSDSFVAWGSNGGCGGRDPNCTEIIGSEKLNSTLGNNGWFSEEKLTEIGKTGKAESIYELSDKVTNVFYEDMFSKSSLPDSSLVTPEEQNTLPYDQYQKLLVERNHNNFVKFVNSNPVFFWKDQWGNWRVYQKASILPQAECGKPVIYLYPTKSMKVNVQVAPTGGLTKTEPSYNDGWNVFATPNSDIYNFADKQTYPYLFWEGNANDFATPDYGYVLKREEVGTKMKQILAIQGLNEKETTDFLEFWQPKLEVRPYVFVTFLPQAEFDQMAPLTVSPKPDKVIRVFMDYQPLDNFVTVKEPNFITPQRTGFTVVEWGGKLN